MLDEARRRLAREGVENVRLAAGDALDILRREAPFDLIFSSWVLGYIPRLPFWAAAAAALFPGGRLAFLVHRENSPREPLEIFGELVARDPSILSKRVAFDFPQGTEVLIRELKAAGLAPDSIREGSVVFRYGTAAEVLDHLLKSGAGTAFYEAIDPSRRGQLTREFLEMLTARHEGKGPFEVVHEYVACIAVKPDCT